MLGKTGILDTNLIGQRCPCIHHPAFFPRISWPKRVQTVWPQWLYQPWPPTLDRSLKSDWPLFPIRALRYYLDRSSDLRQNKEVVFVSFKKGFDKDISPASIFSWIKQTVILCYELSDQEAHSLHQVKVHDVRAFAAPKVFQSGVSLDLVSLPLKSHNTFTQFYLKGVAWADSELYQLGSILAAQQIHKWPLD